MIRSWRRTFQPRVNLLWYLTQSGVDCTINTDAVIITNITNIVINAIVIAEAIP